MKFICFKCNKEFENLNKFLCPTDSTEGCNNCIEWGKVKWIAEDPNEKELKKKYDR